MPKLDPPTQALAQQIVREVVPRHNVLTPVRMLAVSRTADATQEEWELGWDLIQYGITRSEAFELAHRFKAVGIPFWEHSLHTLDASYPSAFKRPDLYPKEYAEVCEMFGTPEGRDKIPIRAARTVEDVLLACEKDPYTLAACERAAPYRLWTFDPTAVGQITGQLPNESEDPGKVGQLSELASGWTAWLRRPEAERDRRSHEYHLARLKSGLPFPKAPILYRYGVHGQHILDGRHRLFAFLEYSKTHPYERVDVYWSDL